MENNRLAWSGTSWRMPLWLWLSLAAMAFSTMHILLDFGVGLFPMQGTLSPAVAAMVVLITIVHLWWVVSLAAGARGQAGGVASAAVLGLGWTLTINGAAIVFCMPPCKYSAPLSDIGHIGSIVLGIMAPAAAIWTLWRARGQGRIGWVLPAGALVLVVATAYALSQTGPT